MAIDGGRSRLFVLGRECLLQIDGEEVSGAADVSVRELVTEVDATGFNHASQSTVVTQRTYEINLAIPDVAYARLLHAKRFVLQDSFLLPTSVEVSLSGGLVNIQGRFTIHDVDADEPLDSAVVSRFVLKQWAH